MAHIIAFGASITYGAWDTEGGWVARLRKYLDTKSLAPGQAEYFLTYNLGISGDNSLGLLERFEAELKPRLDDEEENILIFSIGINDSQFVSKDSKNRISPKDYQLNLTKTLNLAKKYSAKIVFVGITPCDETKTNPLSWDKSKCYKNEYIKKYNGLAKDVCRKNKIGFIDIFPLMLGKNNLLEDGLHPNTEGHKLIYKEVKKWLDGVI